MYDEKTVKVGQMSETARENLVALIPETADYIANTEIDSVSLTLIIESVLNAWRARLDSFNCAHLSIQTRTEITKAIDNARVLLTERRYDELVDEIYCIDVAMEGGEVVEIDDPYTDEEFERDMKQMIECDTKRLDDAVQEYTDVVERYIAEFVKRDEVFSETIVEMANEIDKFTVAYMEQRYDDATRHAKTIMGFLKCI